MGGHEASAFGRLLLRHRGASGMSQSQLARASGMSVRALRDLERGRARAAQQRSAEVLAEGLGLAGDERAEFLVAAQMCRRRTSVPASEPLDTCGLPVPVPKLVGREDELAALRAGAETGGAVAVVGPPGVGKTALAVAAAHHVAAAFPDGCMALDLRGVDEQPLAPRAALERLLRRLGVPDARIPATEAERSSLFRALLRGRRVLLLLDNAADESQVRPLLPTGQEGLTLVTSRRMLVGLSQVRWMRLDPLESADSVALLAEIAGGERIGAEPRAAARLVALCGHLPLALRILGNRLATRPHWSLGYLREMLTDERTRLRRLSAGDLQVRSAFDLSYRRLPPSTRSVFRRLAAVPGVDFGTELAAVSTGVAHDDVDAHLEELTDVGLLQPATVAGRFQFHDLIRVFAAECWRSEEPPAKRELLSAELLEHILSTACTAARVCSPSAEDNDAFSSRQEAVAWLDRETTNWLSCQRWAARLGRHDEVLALAKAMHWYSDRRVYSVPWDQVFRLGAQAARVLGNRREEAVLLNFLGWAQYLCMNEYEAGLATNTEALTIAVEVDDRREQAWAHCYLGIELLHLNRPQEALEHARQAAALSHEFGFFEIRISAYNSYGKVLHALGRFDEALGIHRDLIAQLDRRRAETNTAVLPLYRGVTLERIGDCLAGSRRWRAAAETYHEARSLQSLGGIEGVDGRIALAEGRAWRLAGEYGRARECLETALAHSPDPLFGRQRDRAVAEANLLPDHV